MSRPRPEPKLVLGIFTIKFEVLQIRFPLQVEEFFFYCEGFRPCGFEKFWKVLQTKANSYKALDFTGFCYCRRSFRNLYLGLCH